MKQDPARNREVLVDLPDVLVLSAERKGSMLQVHVETSAARRVAQSAACVLR